ncbi:MAG: PAS domain-containing sensor histidine kinase, partial [Chitinophagaceae bacterium]
IRGEVSFPHATLGKRIYDYILTPVFNEHNEVEAVAGVTRDVTERRIWEESLEKASEELQAMNEEMATTNEELSDANDGLTAANEELAKLNKQLYNARKKIEENEDSLRLAVSAANFGTWRIHSATREFVTDARMKELFGYYPHESLSIEQALAQVQEDFRSYVSTKLENAIYNKGDYDITYPVTGLHDKKLRWLRAIGNLKSDSSGQFSAFTGVVIDVTEQQLENQRKNDFIGMVSHELKTPITSLFGYLQLMNDETGKGENPLMDHALEKSLKQVKKMTRMIDSFLNVARLESGKIFLNKTDFSVNELFGELEEELKHIYTTHLLVFEKGQDISIHADREKIAQVINNLISNAVKYSDHNTLIKVSVELSGNFLAIHVTDSGIGIAAEDLPRIFERFYRADSAHTTAGFGIGLYLCSEIIGLHNGTIGVESEKGKGADFYFSLP